MIDLPSLKFYSDQQVQGCREVFLGIDFFSLNLKRNLKVAGKSISQEPINQIVPSQDNSNRQRILRFDTANKLIHSHNSNSDSLSIISSTTKKILKKVDLRKMIANLGEQKASAIFSIKQRVISVDSKFI